MDKNILRNAVNKTAQLMSINSAEMITLTKNPANRTGFKIVRSSDKEKENKLKILTNNNIARSSDLLSITLPDGITRTEAEEIAKKFHLTNDYDIVEQDGGFILLRRGAETEGVEVTKVPMANGMVATITATAFRAESKVSEDARTKSSFSEITGVTLVCLDFDNKVFRSVDAVQNWLAENAVDFREKGVEQNNLGITVHRHLAEHSKTRRIDICEGITGYVIRSEVNDIPEKIKRQVLDAAYGNWGWGHLDFVGAMVDPEFTSKSWDAVYTLQNVLENIIFYSNLSLDDRKLLVENACNQFSLFMSTLIDALPTTISGLVERTDQFIREDQDMATNDKDQKTAAEIEAEKLKAEEAAKRAAEETASKEAEEAAKAEAEKAAAAAEDDKQFITRSEAEEIISKKFEELNATLTKRSEEDQQNINKSIEALTEAMTKGMEGINKKIEELDGTTVSRSDDDDGEGDDHGSKTKRSDDVFAGMFNHIRPGASN